MADEKERGTVVGSVEARFPVSLATRSLFAFFSSKESFPPRFLSFFREKRITRVEKRNGNMRGGENSHFLRGEKDDEDK